MHPVQETAAAIVLPKPLQFLPVDAEQLCQAAFLNRQRNIIIVVSVFPFYIFLCQTGKPRLNKLFDIRMLFIGDQVFFRINDLILTDILDQPGLFQFVS